jgi:carbamoyl-phosphate synthase large subunit
VTRVMIAGIGGASLGTELLKCFRLAGGYEVFGCDVSSYAYGIYERGFARTFVISEVAYVDQVLSLCSEHAIRFLVPGGERPMVLLGAAAEALRSHGVTLLGNAPEVISVCSDKNATFALLEKSGISIPRYAVPSASDVIEEVGLPCIVKPSTGSGGSASVFFATTVEEAMVYANLIRRGGVEPTAQEYLDDGEGEFTIGVLSLQDGTIAASVAMKRVLDSKLSVSYRARGGLISSGYSQGWIEDFPGICGQAERIATALNSRGPINVQGRLRGGLLVPFEVNPRFSASTYLRAMAGFNEVDTFVRHIRDSIHPVRGKVRPGLYLRSLTEQHVSPEAFR